MRRAFLALLSIFAFVVAGSRETPAPSTDIGEMTAPNNTRPIFGLALGGGGAKAAAEIGVLKYLEKEGVKIDCIVGTSMGAVVGGLFAVGYSAEEIETMWLNEDWLTLFDETAVFVGGDRTIFGLVKGDDFEHALREMLELKGCRRIEETRIKFGCVATNIIDENTLSEKDFTTGDMAKAIRASMTYPVGYSPVLYDGMKLVDGGLLNNLPVDVVKSMGSKKVIAVDLEKRQRNNRMNININAGLGWLGNWLLTHHADVNKRNENRRLADIYIHPDLSEFGITDFGQMDAKDMIFYGEDEASKYRNALRGEDA